jgi:hypothetical protein
MRRLMVPTLMLLLAAAARGQAERPDSLDQEVRLGDVGEGEDIPAGDLLAPDSGRATRLLEFRSRVAVRTDLPEGYASGAFAGLPFSSYQRLRVFPTGSVSAGVLLEKDPGERRLSDFAAGHIAFRSGEGLIRAAVLGDYLVETGQGLSLWKGIDVGRGADVAGPVARTGRGVVPYLSAGEDAFFRGAAVTLGLGAWRLQGFVSHRSLDATMEGDVVTGLSSGGFHRTASEESKRGVLGERLAGATLDARFGGGSRAGLSVYRGSFSRQLRIGNGPRFSGDHVTVLSADVRFVDGPWALFGEMAYGNGAAAVSAGCVVRPARTLDVVVAVRSYPYEFYSLHGNAFAARSGMSDERGIYCAVRYAPARRFGVTAYWEMYQFPGGSGRDRFSSGGSARMLEVAADPVERCRLSLRYTERESGGAYAVRDGEGLLAERPATDARRAARCDAEYRSADGVRFRARWELVQYAPAGERGAERGAMVFADLAGKLGEALRWGLRLAFYQASSYDARIVLYEPDLEGVTTMPALVGEGVRWSCLARWAPVRAAAISAKYAVQLRDDVRRIGSGPDRLGGNKDGKVSVQLDLEL